MRRAANREGPKSRAMVTVLVDVIDSDGSNSRKASVLQVHGVPLDTPVGALLSIVSQRTCREVHKLTPDRADDIHALLRQAWETKEPAHLTAITTALEHDRPPFWHFVSEESCSGRTEEVEPVLRDSSVIWARPNGDGTYISRTPDNRTLKHYAFPSDLQVEWKALFPRAVQEDEATLDITAHVPLGSKPMWTRQGRTLLRRGSFRSLLAACNAAARRGPKVIFRLFSLSPYCLMVTTSGKVRVVELPLVWHKLSLLCCMKQGSLLPAVGCIVEHLVKEGAATEDQSKFLYMLGTAINMEPNAMATDKEVVEATCGVVFMFNASLALSNYFTDALKAWHSRSRAHAPSLTAAPGHEQLQVQTITQELWDAVARVGAVALPYETANVGVGYFRLVGAQAAADADADAGRGDTAASPSGPGAITLQSMRLLPERDATSPGTRHALVVLGASPALRVGLASAGIANLCRQHNTPCMSFALYGQKGTPHMLQAYTTVDATARLQQDTLSAWLERSRSRSSSGSGSNLAVLDMTIACTAAKDEDTHAVLVIINHDLRQLFYFDPFGSGDKSFTSHCAPALHDTDIREWLTRHVAGSYRVHFVAGDVETGMGPQQYLVTRDHELTDVSKHTFSTCALWCFWFLHMCLQFSALTPEQVLQEALQVFGGSVTLLQEVVLQFLGDALVLLDPQIQRTCIVSAFGDTLLCKDDTYNFDVVVLLLKVLKQSMTTHEHTMSYRK
jgi:hypothetical protein